MKVLHCCLACFYIDGFGYQENILPKMHSLQGHDVAILASTETYLPSNRLGHTVAGEYRNRDGIPVRRLPYIGGIPRKLASKLRIYRGLDRALEEFAPDLVFLHDCQFLSIRQVARYAQGHPHVKIVVDGHTDFGNSAKTWISKYLLHGLIYRYCAKIIEPYVAKFYGVLPARVDFFRKMYGVPESKLDLLVLGADDTMFDLTAQPAVRSRVRAELGLEDTDFVVITGGKIDRRKEIHTLLRAVRDIETDKIKLIVFGRPTEDMRSEIHKLSEHERIRNVGWKHAADIYDLLLASDLACFPGTHSVLWEQAVGVGLPCVFRAWPGMQHVDLGGNCIFVAEATVEAIQEPIRQAHEDVEQYNAMRRVAMSRGVAAFSYSQIAERAVQV